MPKIVDALYFDKPGSQNTVKTLQHARRRFKNLNIGYVVVALGTGGTGVKALRFLEA